MPSELFGINAGELNTWAGIGDFILAFVIAILGFLIWCRTKIKGDDCLSDAGIVRPTYPTPVACSLQEADKKEIEANLPTLAYVPENVSCLGIVGTVSTLAASTVAIDFLKSSIQRAPHDVAAVIPKSMFSDQVLSDFADSTASTVSSLAGNLATHIAVSNADIPIDENSIEAAAQSNDSIVDNALDAIQSFL